MNIKKIVITGATSSLGIALIDECIKQNIEVLAICNRNSKNLQRIPQHALVTVTECELSAFSDYEVDWTVQYDVFFHLAWASTQGDVARNNLQSQVENIQFALDAVDLAEKLGCKVFIGAGSQAEYGRKEQILTEQTPCDPETAYGMAKLCAGQMTRLACKQRGIKHIWPRILSAYGPNCQPQTIINYTITELLQGRKPLLSGGEQIWDFIYTGDVARALLLLAQEGKNGEVYVVGSGKSRKLKEYLKCVRKIVIDYNRKSKKSTEFECPQLGLGERPYGDQAVMHLVGDINKLQHDTGFEIDTEFEEGIQKTIKWIYKQILSQEDKYNEET